MDRAAPPPHYSTSKRRIKSPSQTLILMIELHGSNQLVEWLSLGDNTSNRQAETLWIDCSTCECPSNPVTVLLRGTTSIVRRLARLYSSSPVVLVVVPMLIGLVAGILVGRALEKRDESSGDYVASGLATFAQTLSSRSAAFRSIFRWGSNTANDHVGEERNISTNETRESGVDIAITPKHIAVIMDGNRRYGRDKYGSVTKGHIDGSKTLVEFARWCIAEGIQVLTVYAFSTENWNRDPSEVASLMSLFCTYCEELREEAKRRNIRLCVLSTETDRIPENVMSGLRQMVEETKHFKGGLTMNICLSYGSRGEIVNACRELAADVLDGKVHVNRIQEQDIKDRLLTRDCIDPDVVIRTSGELRLSNFLLWQLAYSEMFFIPKQWPQLQKEDLLAVIRAYATGRIRRYGK